MRTRIPDLLRLLLALFLAINAVVASAANATGVAPGDVAPAGHHGHDGGSGMDRGDGPAGAEHGDCCDDETAGGCDCRCALHQPVASRPAFALPGHVNDVLPAIFEIGHRPSNTTTTPFRPPA